MDETQTGCLTGNRVTQRQFATSNKDLNTGFRLVKTCQDLDQSGFTAAVLADQRADFSRRNINADIVQCNLRPENLRCVTHTERGYRRCRGCHRASLTVEPRLPTNFRDARLSKYFTITIRYRFFPLHSVQYLQSQRVHAPLLDGPPGCGTVSKKHSRAQVVHRSQSMKDRRRAHHKSPT